MSNNPTFDVFGNLDLLREIGRFLDPKLPFILSCRSAQVSLRPRDIEPGSCWITSNKKDFVTSVEMVEWAKSFNCNFSFHKNYRTLFCYAATNESIEVLEWVFEQYSVSNYPELIREDVCDSAAEKGRLKVLQYLRSLDPPCKWHCDTCSKASSFGFLEVLKWLKSQIPSCPWDKYTGIFAAEQGHLHILIWLKTLKDNPVHDKYLFYPAARGGKIHILSWLRENNPGFAIENAVLSIAANYGHLEVLIWMRNQNPPFPWDESSCYSAVLGNHLRVLKWLRSQNPPCLWVLEECLGYAREKEFLEMVLWLESGDNSGVL